MLTPTVTCCDCPIDALCCPALESRTPLRDRLASITHITPTLANAPTLSREPFLVLAQYAVIHASVYRAAPGWRHSAIKLGSAASSATHVKWTPLGDSEEYTEAICTAIGTRHRHCGRTMVQGHAMLNRLALRSAQDQREALSGIGWK